MASRKSIKLVRTLFLRVATYILPGGFLELSRKLLQRKVLGEILRTLFWLAVFLAPSFFSPTSSFAYRESYDEEGSTKLALFKLIRGPFGTLVMLFCGLGGFVTLYMRRAGDSSQKTPVLGIALLLLAAFVFAYRIMISSGMMGKEFIDYGN